MKVYKIRFESDKFQCLSFDGGENEPVFLPRRQLHFDGTPKVNWVSPPLVIANPHAKKGGFVSSFPGCLVMRSAAVEKLGESLEVAGELLPVEFNAEHGFLLNVLQVVDCMDHEQSDWAIAKDGVTRLLCRRFAFRLDALPESTLFKVPGLSASMFAHTGLPGSTTSFCSKVGEHKLTGLRFELVWDSDA